MRRARPTSCAPSTPPRHAPPDVRIRAAPTLLRVSSPVVAVVGGGQLARMLAEPAAALGIPLRLLAEAEDVSAAQVIPDTIIGDHRDLEALRKVTSGAAGGTLDPQHGPPHHPPPPARAAGAGTPAPAGPA